MTHLFAHIDFENGSVEAGVVTIMFSVFGRWEKHCQELAVENAGMYLTRGPPQEDTDVTSPLNSNTAESVDAVRIGNVRYPCVEVCGVELPLRQLVSQSRYAVVEKTSVVINVASFSV